jgi:hypothetical protein
MGGDAECSDQRPVAELIRLLRRPSGSSYAPARQGLMAPCVSGVG